MSPLYQAWDRLTMDCSSGSNESEESILKLIQIDNDERSERLSLPQTPYNQAKFYTAMRHRLEGMELPASALAVLTALHTLCDADTGRFYRDDVTVRKVTQLSKSTVSWGFKRLLAEAVVLEEKGAYLIAGYEEDRTSEKSYFRLSNTFLAALPKMVQHHNPRILLFSLELLDRGRNHGAELVYSTSTLIHKRRLGSCPSRVNKGLQFLTQCFRYAYVPNSTGTDNNIHFYLVQETNEDTNNQERFRKLHGEVSYTTKKSFQFAQGTKQLEWRELARTTRIIIQYGMENRLTDYEVGRLAGLFGAYYARNNVQRPVPYLRKALPDLLGYVRDLVG